MNFKNKIVLITGARKGIGFAIVKKFLTLGAFIIGTSKSHSGVNFINKYLGKQGLAIKLDVTKKTSIKNFLKKINIEFRHIDILINNIGIIFDKLLINMKENDWKSVIDINLNSVFLISKYIIKLMIKKKYGRIINLGSFIGSVGNIGQSNYSASKAGLVGLSKSLSYEVASMGITVNVISPGFIITDMTKSLTLNKRKYFLSKIPMNRFGFPEEISNVVAFIASEESSYITGEVINVNGGICLI
ncbi:MAG: 3-oxoacyl-ACP reductase FabG [Candidatus Makana argininalis]